MSCILYLSVIWQLVQIGLLSSSYTWLLFLLGDRDIGVGWVGAGGGEGEGLGGMVEGGHSGEIIS